MARLEPGRPAPSFRLDADDGSTLALEDLHGQTVVLYFYPKDDTGGCTVQACDFRDRAADFDAKGARIIGVSPDAITSHTKFRDKHGLTFTLLSDPEHTAAEAYGVWVEKSMYGRTYMGIERSTFVIGPDGKHHAGSVLELIGG
jgi:thioredoxin-dependent peroxiredoxin